MCNMKNHWKTLLLSLLLLPASCTSTPAQLPLASIDPQTPNYGTHGVDTNRLELMREIIEELELPIDSVLVRRHGELVFETYPNPSYGPGDKHLLYSVTKSVTSALIGIAIEQGFIESIDQKVIDFFPEWEIDNFDSRKQDLTIEHLLTMTCGFEWEGPDDNLHTWGDANRSGNPVKFVLNQPMASEPGTQWVYNGGCSHILSAILTKTTGHSTLQFARENLFEPLGITDVRWPRDPQGIYYGGQDIWLTPRDMSMFGQLFLNNGVWKEQQVVPAEWVTRSSSTHITHWIGGYGYQWWTYPESGIYYASGANEQRIYVVPAYDMVVVFTANNKAEDLAQGEIREGPPVVDWLLGRFILPATDTYTESTYSGFGFSLGVPVGVQAQELGKGWQGSASEGSGLVQFNFGDSPYEAMGVQWETLEATPDLQLVLEAFSQDLQRMGVEIQASGELTPAMKGDHEVRYQAFEVLEGKYTYPGVIGAWYCDETRRAFIFYFGTVPELVERIDPLVAFQRYLETFECHP